MWLAVSGGGDRDTICAIVGGVVAQSRGLLGLKNSMERRQRTTRA
ncbi:hypothetical protein [Caldimonas brevitalea]